MRRSNCAMQRLTRCWMSAGDVGLQPPRRWLLGVAGSRRSRGSTRTYSRKIVGCATAGSFARRTAIGVPGDGRWLRRTL